MPKPDLKTLPAAGRWQDGELPPNVELGPGTIIIGEQAFHRFHSEQPAALRVGEQCTLDGVHFALGANGRVQIGDFCFFSNTILLCEQELRIGSYVSIGWNTTIADTDFHPLSPSARLEDAIACSPAGKHRRRPPIPTAPVIVEDDVWIGPNVTLLKGVRVGAGAFIEPGSLVTRSVPPRARVLGNPARVIGKV